MIGVQSIHYSDIIIYDNLVFQLAKCYLEVYSLYFQVVECILISGVIR